MLSATDCFVNYLFEKASAISNQIYIKAKTCKEDYFAVAAAGAAKNRSHWEPVLKIAPEGCAELIGYPEKTDRKTAALINGFNAHALELDDGQRFAMIHLGASVISSIHAATEGRMISETDFLKGIVMGYEAACRTAIAMQPSHKNLGFHTAGTCGTIGAAVGAAFSLGMNRQQMKRVITCAVSSAAGMLEIQEQKSELKPYNTGRAAMDGLTAAFMGLTDYEVPDDILGGERGLYHLYSKQWDINQLTEPAAYFEIERIYLKPYASCRHSHSAVEAAIRLHRIINPDSVEHVEVKTYRLGVKGHDHTDIPGIASAKLSTPYAVAAALVYGRADLTVFEPLDKKLVDYAKKIKVSEDPDLTAESPGKRIAIVTAALKDGSCVSQRVDYAKGDPENPMTDEELQAKIQLLNLYAEQRKEELII